MLWYTSDNGPEGDRQSTASPGNAGPFRGRKRGLFEGGIRAAASTSDYLPAIRSALNQPLPKELDGINLLPILDGKRPLRQSPLAFETINDTRGSQKLCWIEDRWKLLPNLDADSEEMNNLAASQPRLASALRAKLEEWRASCARSRQGL